MRVIVLDATNKSITAVLAGAAATNPDFTASYADATATALTEGANDGALNGTTPVTIVAAPAASTRRMVKSISIQNRDTAAVVLTVRYVDGANTRQIWSGTLAVGDTWTMDGVMNALGSMKTAFAGSHTALSDIGTNTHAQIDTHIADTSDPHGANLSQSTINLTGGQIAFPAAQAASADVNTLDDYEEGTWTPTITFAAAGDLNVVYAAERTGYYIKVGKLVLLWVSVGTSTFTHTTAVGNLRITGLPFTIANNANHSPVGGTLAFQGITKANYTQFAWMLNPNVAYLEIEASGSGQAISDVSVANVPTGGTVYFRGTCFFIATA